MTNNTHNNTHKNKHSKIAIILTLIIIFTQFTNLHTGNLQVGAANELEYIMHPEARIIESAQSPTFATYQIDKEVRNPEEFKRVLYEGMKNRATSFNIDYIGDLGSFADVYDMG